jgi:aminopeptidase N
MLGHLATLDALAEGEPERALVRRYTASLAGPRFARLGWDEKPDESTEERQLRAMLAGSLARIGDAAVIAEGRARFERFLKDPASVPPSMIDFVMRVAGRYGDAATYEALASRAAQAQSVEERNRYARAMTLARDPALAQRTLTMALSPDLPAALTSTLVPSVARGEHIDLAWSFATANRAALLKDQESIGQNRFFPSVVSSSSNPAHADMMEAYVKQNFGPDAQVEAQRVANAIRTRAAQKTRLLPQVRAALK